MAIYSFGHLVGYLACASNASNACYVPFYLFPPERHAHYRAKYDNGHLELDTEVSKPFVTKTLVWFNLCVDCNL